MSNKLTKQQKRALRVRKNIHGTEQRPRLCVTTSAKNIYAQLIDDDAGKTLMSGSSLVTPGADGLKPVEVASEVGKLFGQKAVELKVESIVFDRGGRKFHGRVKAFADGVREAGVKF
jgi:large subunit ribosomal protein L18